MSLNRSTRRAETSKQLDRDTWADLDKVDYKIRVEAGTAAGGEALAGPFWFGRAFDAPPFFTFSAVAVGGDQGVAPQLTIGVAEWLQDEQDMYVGAMLWFKCALCWEPVRTGGSQTREFPPWEPPPAPPRSGGVFKEDFEDWQSRPQIFGGPEGNEIVAWGRVLETGTVAAGYYWPSRRSQTGFADFAPPILKTHKFRPGTNTQDALVRGPTDPYTFTGRYDNWDFPWLRTPFHLSNANPKSGAWHMRCIQQPLLTSADFSDVHVPAVQFAALIPCKTPVDQTFDEGSAPYLRAEPGMTVWVGCDAMVSDEYDQIQSQLFFDCSLYDSQLRNIGNASGGWPYVNGIPVGTLSMGRLFNSYNRYDRQFYLIQDNGDPDPNTFINWPGNDSGAGSFSEFANSQIHYISVRVEIGNNPTSPNLPYPEKVFDLDNITIDIIGPGANTLPTKFDVTLNFSGQLLKNYVGVHPLRSYEYPAKIVLS